MASSFVISLDFELLWGVRDHADRQSYGVNVLGARTAVPWMLDLFVEADVRATWATVGFVMCEDRDELEASLPALEHRPAYVNSRVSNYAYLDEVGADEASAPHYFGASLVRRIDETPGQEIGTHTLSHYYCLEDGQSLSAFEADLVASVALAKRRGITLRSIVFPRNQYGADHLEICAHHGILAYRGNPATWAYSPARRDEQTPIRRALRLADAYSGMLGHQAFATAPGRPVNVPASRFLRPCSGWLAPLHPLHLSAVLRGMSAAARAGQNYHLWWHPHNFGRDLRLNLDGLEAILAHYRNLRDAYGWQSRSMSEVASCV